MKAHQWMACVLVASGMGLAASRANAEVLGPGYSLAPGQRLYSASNTYFATLGSDGDFSVYRTSDGARAWSTGTRGSGAVAARMLRDGRFVLSNATGGTVWSTPTRGRHRLFGVSARGQALVINARKWRPRDKKADIVVERVLNERGKLDWQSPAFDSPAKRNQATAPHPRRGGKHSPRVDKPD